jgi:FkbM family methyltransferase
VSVEELAADWGLPHSKPPWWLRVLDWVRQHLGYRLRMGRRLHAAIGRRLPPTMDTRIFPGIAVRVDLSQDVARSTWWLGRGYEAPTPAVLAGWLRDAAEVFFDIGANCGWFSYFALSCSQVEVFAFEPRADLFQQLQTAKRLNGLDRFHPQQLGLSDQTETLRLQGGHLQTGYSTFGPHPNLVPEGNPLTVVPFDDWRLSAGIALPSEPAWVAKIDVEGFEANVLRGMSESLASRAFAGLTVELNAYTLGFCGSSVDEVTELLTDAGYRMMTVRHQEASLNRFFVPT